MEAVVNKKDPKDKQALELFQYKSSLRFCVPSYIFSFNGRCGPRGVTYSRHASGHCSKKTVNSHFSMCLLENVNHIGSLLPMGGVEKKLLVCVCPALIKSFVFVICFSLFRALSWKRFLLGLFIYLFSFCDWLSWSFSIVSG